MTRSAPALIADLQQRVQGDVYHDELRLGMYGTDASIYQILPVAVVCPKDESDVGACLAIARAHGVPVLARGGGTSLAGQTVAEAIVLDFSKYMDAMRDRKSTRLNSSHVKISYAVFCLKKKK